MTRNARALTLAELVIALAVTSVVATAVAGVAMALSTAHAQVENYGQFTHCARVAVVQMSRIIRASALVASSDSTTVVLWTGDADGSGTINYGELAVIAYDSSAQEVRLVRVVFPKESQGALNRMFSLSELANPRNVEAALRGSAYAQTSVLATGVTSAAFSAFPSPPYSTLIAFRLTMGKNSDVVTVNGAAALRAERTSQVVVRNGKYYLATE